MRSLSIPKTEKFGTGGEGAPKPKKAKPPAQTTAAPEDVASTSWAPIDVSVPVWPGRRLDARDIARAQLRGWPRKDGCRDHMHSRASDLARPVAVAASEVGQAANRAGRSSVGVVIEAERLVLEVDLDLDSTSPY